MDLTVKAPEVTHSISAINIAGYVRALCTLQFQRGCFYGEQCVFVQIVNKLYVM